MAYIKIISPGEAQGKLADLYQLVRGPGGQVDQVLQIHSLRPHTLRGHMGLYKAVLHDTRNELPGWYLECIGVLVSRINACAYCDLHHSTGLRRLLQRSERAPGPVLEAIDAVLAGTSSPIFTQRERGGLDYAAKLTRSPGAIEVADVEQLRALGFRDGEVLEINQVTAYFAYANRTVTGLGVSSAGETLGLSPENDDREDDWSHA